MRKFSDHLEDYEGRVPTFLKESEVAKILRVSVKTLQNWRWRGLPPKYMKFGGAVRYRYEDIVNGIGDVDSD